MLKKILLGLLAILLLFQLYRPAKNQSNDQTYAMSTAYPVPSEVSELLKVACNDCHSNMTRYPWYANLQPVRMWMDDHVDHGKGHLNFSDFTRARIAIQNHKFEEIIETVEEGEMPLDDYTMMGMHPEANLSEEQRELIIGWAKEQMDSIAARYPADSLILRRKKRPTASR